VILADDHTLIRKGLRALLDGENDLSVVAEAENGRTAVELALEHRPDVVVMDVAMPELNGIEATRRIRRELPDTKVLALSMHPAGSTVAEMLKSGASGYLLKSCAMEELTLALRAVQRGQKYLSPNVAGGIVDDYLQSLAHNEGKTAVSVLSDREREVLQLVSEGLSTKEIAARLYITPKTVDAHRQRIMDKLEIHSVAELTRYALREGITTL
jgi:DNA-binding NarL/FixJ family response regulator